MRHLLRKSTLLSAGAVAISALGLWATSERAEVPDRPQLPEVPSMTEAPEMFPSKSEDDIVFHGGLEQSNRSDWSGVGTASQRYGVYSFDLNSLPKAEGPIQDNRSSCGGLWVDERYYCLARSNSTLNGYTTTWVSYDTDTWKRTNTAVFSTPTLTDCSTMAYDYITGTAYAAGINSDNNSTQLRTIDLATGEMTNVANISGIPGAISGMAFDSEGQLWATYKDTPNYNHVNLYKIDKTTGVATLVKVTDLQQKSIQSALCFDHRNNKLYYTARMVEYYSEVEGGPKTSEDYSAGLFEIALPTGEVKKVLDFPEWEVFASLYIEDSHPLAPEGVKNLTFKYKSGSLTEGSVTCTLPTQTYNRKPLSGNLKIEIYVDGDLVETKTGLKPGAEFTGDNIMLSREGHMVKVYAYNSDNNKSIARHCTVYGGHDRPAAVGNLQVAYTPHHDAATLTWEAPELGHNGGNLTNENVTYKVVRRPDWVTVAEGLTECTFTDTPDRQQELTQYEVYAVSEGGESDAVRTTPEIVGAPAQLPYRETFDSYTAFYRFTVLKNEELAREDGNYWMFDPNNSRAIYYLSYQYYGQHVPTDGWIVTPTIDFKEGYAYRVEWNSTLGGKYYHHTNTIDINVGEFPTKESLNRVVYSNTYYIDEDDAQLWSTIFVANKGDKHIAFHNYSNTALSYTVLDNLRITEYGPAGIPAAPEVLGFEKDDESITIDVKLPTLNVAGKPVDKITDVRLYTADRKRLIAMTKVESGQTTVKITDKHPIFGFNDYAVVANNAEGLGMEAIYKVNFLPDQPKSVENLNVATANDGRDIEVSWAYPSDMLGVDGNPLTVDDLSYDIYVSTQDKRTQIANVPGTDNSYTIGSIMDNYPQERQKYLTVEVVARTRGGVSEKVAKNVLCGSAYEIPLHENFNDMITPWDKEQCVYAYFQNNTSSWWDPKCEATEGKLLSFIPNSSTGLGVYISPRLNLTGLVKPKFKFSVWNDPLDKLAGAFIQIGVLVEKDGVEQPIEYISPKYSVQAESAGWVEHEVDLSDYAKYPRVSIVFRAQGQRNGNIHIDWFDISGEKPAYDARLLKLDGPSNIMMGRDNNYYVSVDNNGQNDLKDVKVTLSFNGEVVETRTLDLAVGQSETLPFNYNPALYGEEVKGRMTAKVEAENDMNPYNNESGQHVNIEAPNLPYVNDLAAKATEDGKMHLFWSDAATYPHEIGISDDLESYPDFTISNFGDWTVYDVDGFDTWPCIGSNYGNFVWPNAGVPQAWINFNPAKVTLSLASGVLDVTSLVKAHSGARCFANFQSAPGPNNDWLVTPALSGSQQVFSFYVKTLMGYDNPEVFSIMVSSSGNNVEDFTPLRENVELTSVEWQKYAVTLPAGTRYVAIVGTSTDGFALLVDDFEFIPEQPAVELTGYNVYRDYQLLAEGIGETEHVADVEDPAAKHYYHVTATYSDGESIFSNGVYADVLGVAQMPVSDDCVIYAGAGRIVVKAPAGSPVTVHTLDGRCLYSFASTGAESMRVAPGIYIVRAGTSTAKLIVR